MNSQHRPFRPRAARGLGLGLAAGLVLSALVAPALLLAEEVFGTYRGGAVGQRVGFERGGETRRSWAGTMNFELDSGESLRVYCIQVEVPVRAGDRYRSDGPVENLANGCQIRYILDNFPAAEATEAEEAAARQMAVWHFSDGVDLSTIAEDDAAIRERAQEITAAAVGGHCPPTRTAAPRLRLEPPAARAEAGQRIAYTVTAGVPDAGQTVHVTVTGVGLLDDGGQQADLELDATGAATFGVTAAGAGAASVSVALPYRLGAGTVFSHIDDNRPTQRLVMAEVVDLVARAASEAGWDESPTPTVPAPTPTPTATVPAVTPVTPTQAPTATPTSWETPVGAVTATVPATATATGTARAGTPGAAVTPAPQATPQLPERLPSTGRAADTPWNLLALAAMLAVAVWLTGRSLRRA